MATTDAEPKATKAKEDKGPATRTYLGPAISFKDGPDGRPTAPGEKVALTDDQLRQLTGLGHLFDPPFVESTELPAPHEVPDLEPAQVDIPARA